MTECAMCGRKGERGFKREALLNAPQSVIVCVAKTACMRRYRENRKLAALSEPC